MIKENLVTIVLDTNLFSTDAILGACHKFLANYFVDIAFDANNEHFVNVELKDKEDSPVDADELTADFKEEVINYAMKIKILEGSAKIRDQIFHIVFNPERLGSEGDALQNELEFQDGDESVKLNDKLEQLLNEIEEEEDALEYQDDPLGISVPWEEKYGKPEDILHPVEQLRQQDNKNLINVESSGVKDVIDS